MAGTYRLPYGNTVAPWVAAAGPPPASMPVSPAMPRGWAQVVNESGLPIPGRPEFVSLARLSQPLKGVAGVGATPPDGMSAGAYATISLIGAATGGALIGYLSSADAEGAMTGGLFTTGLAGISDAFLLAREDSGAMLPMFAVGLGALGWSLFRFSRALQGGKGRGAYYGG